MTHCTKPTTKDKINQTGPPATPKSITGNPTKPESVKPRATTADQTNLKKKKKKKKKNPKPSKPTSTTENPTNPHRSTQITRNPTNTTTNSQKSSTYLFIPVQIMNPNPKSQQLIQQNSENKQTCRNHKESRVKTHSSS
jgi:hypothetical protein